MISDRIWAIHPETLAEMRALDVEGAEVDREPVEALISGGCVAVIPVMGPLEPRVSLMGFMMGGSSYAEIRAMLAMADEDPAVESIVLDVDSPGGTVAGAHETFLAVAACSKPVLAMVNGLCTSAAYWVASAADSIIASPTSVIGQVGTQRVMIAPGDDAVVMTDEAAPLKNADPRDEPEQYQAILNELGGIFRADVAKGRGVSTDDVAQNFGRGAVLSARAAHEAGMIDGLTDTDEEDDMAEDTGRASAEAEAPDEDEAPEDEMTMDEAMSIIASLRAELAELKAADDVVEDEDEPEARAVAMLREQHGSVTKAIMAYEGRFEALERERYEDKRAAAMTAALKSGHIRPDETTRKLAILAYDTEHKHGGEALFSAMLKAAPAVPMARQSTGEAGPRPANGRASLHDAVTAHIAEHGGNYGEVACMLAASDK